MLSIYDQYTGCSSPKIIETKENLGDLILKMSFVLAYNTRILDLWERRVIYSSMAARKYNSHSVKVSIFYSVCIFIYLLSTSDDIY